MFNVTARLCRLRRQTALRLCRLKRAERSKTLTDRDRTGKKLTQRLYGRNHRSRSTAIAGHHQRNTQDGQVLNFDLHWHCVQHSAASRAVAECRVRGQANEAEGPRAPRFLGDDRTPIQDCRWQVRKMRRVRGRCAPRAVYQTQISNSLRTREAEAHTLRS